MAIEDMDEDFPRYKLLQPFYADDVLWAEGEVIEFGGIPNEAMEPLNKPAKVKMREFLASLPGGGTPALADAIQAAMEDRPRHEGSVRGVSRPKEKALMGDKSLHGKGAVRHVELAPEKEIRRPARIMGTVQDEIPSPGLEHS